MANFLPSVYLMPATSVSSTNVYTSLPLDIREISRFSVQTVFTSGATGTFAIQGSVDYGILGNQSPTWSTFGGVTMTNPAGVAGGQLVDVPETGVPFVRVVYTNTGGTGTITVLGAAKGL